MSRIFRFTGVEELVNEKHVSVCMDHKDSSRKRKDFAAMKCYAETTSLKNSAFLSGKFTTFERVTNQPRTLNTYKSLQAT